MPVHAGASVGSGPIAGDPDAGRWPDFVGIGAIKSGTTWLWQCLREHEQIFMPAMKELEFFDGRFDRGYDWYRGFFAGARGRLCGEISPQYMHCPDSVERMLPLVGRAKLIVCLREPGARAYSHFMMDAREMAGASDADKRSHFDRLVDAADSKYIRFGRYAEQLEPYVLHFGAQNVHVLLYEDIARQPQSVIRRVCAFLGVNDEFHPVSLGERVNPSKRYRSVRLFNLLRSGVRGAERLGLGELILFLKKTAVRDRVLGLLEAPEQYGPMSTQARARLDDYYAPLNDRLSVLIGRDLGPWKSG